MAMSPKLLRPRQTGYVAPDAAARAYIAAVEAADGQKLEVAVAQAINEFVVGCKADGTFGAIKACCILAGARTLSGALTPLVGASPTNANFVGGDYNRKGLLGNGTNKTLNSNRANNADPQDNAHQAVYAMTTATSGRSFIGAGVGAAGTTRLSAAVAGLSAAMRLTGSVATFSLPGNPPASGFIGGARNNASNYSIRYLGATQTGTQASGTPSSAGVSVFSTTGGTGTICDARLAYYSIGESLDLALLDSRISALMTAIGAAIP